MSRIPTATQTPFSSASATPATPPGSPGSAAPAAAYPSTPGSGNGTSPPASSPPAPTTVTVDTMLSKILPGAPRRPTPDITKCKIWLYGPPKIGKTTLAASFPGVWFLATERGQDWITVREPTYIESWNHFLQVCSAIDKARPTKFADGEPIRTIAIDTFDGLFKMCFDQVCSDMGVSDPGEIPHGGGWSKLDREISRVMSKVAMWPYGHIWISHERSKEVKAKGRKYDRAEPNVGAAGARWCNQAADLILHATMDEIVVKDSKGQPTGEIREQRILELHPSTSAVAGGRMADRLPPVIDLSYDALMREFAASPASAENVRPALKDLV